jgi:predicted RNA-binding protein with TRAM domain
VTVPPADSGTYPTVRIEPVTQTVAFAETVTVEHA